MTVKNFKIIKILIIVLIAVLASQSVIHRNFIVPIMGIALGSAVLFYFRRRVKGVMADERDYKIGGRAAILTIQIYSWVSVVIMFFLYSRVDSNPSFEFAASLLAFLVCFSLILYSILFKYFNKHEK